MQMLRFHGSRDKNDFELVGYNSRLDELQAAMLRIFLAELEALERRPPRGRRALRGARARRSRRDARRTSPATSTTSSAAARPERDRLRGCAEPRPGSGSPTYYTTPLHLQPSLRYLGYEPGDLPETEQVARENFCVPLWAGNPGRERRSAWSTTVRAAVASPVA